MKIRPAAISRGYLIQRLCRIPVFVPIIAAPPLTDVPLSLYKVFLCIDGLIHYTAVPGYHIFVYIVRSIR